MKIQTSHLSECQSRLTSPMGDRPLTRKGRTAIQATTLVHNISNPEKLYELIDGRYSTQVLFLYLSNQTIIEGLGSTFWITNRWFISKVM